MRTLNQPAFEALVAWQRSSSQDSADHDIRDIELSGLTISQSLDGITMAMSRLRNVSFATGASLQGVTWIGNEVLGCTFSGTSMNKGEMLDCIFEDSQISQASLFRSDWSGSAFRHCKLEALDLSGTCLINTLFEACDFTDVRVGAGGALNGRHTLRFDETGRLDPGASAAQTEQGDNA